MRVLSRVLRNTLNDTLHDTWVLFATPALTCGITPNNTLVTPSALSMTPCSLPLVKRGRSGVEGGEAEVETEMIKVEPCKGCGGALLVDRFMGLTVRCEVTPLDAQAAGAALLAGQTLHRVMYLGGRPSSFSSASPAVLGALRAEPSERPMVVVTHQCTVGATGARLTASQEVGGTQAPKAPQSPPAGRGAPFSGHSSPSSTAPTAANRPSDPPTGPRCSGCGHPCADGTYSAIHLGDLLVWAAHVENCGKE